jgi:hypothetical protein
MTVQPVETPNEAIGDCAVRGPRTPPDPLSRIDLEWGSRAAARP